MGQGVGNGDSPFTFPHATLPPLASRLSPLASPLSPLASPLSPLPSRLSPLASPLSPLPSPLSPRSTSGIYEGREGARRVDHTYDVSPGTFPLAVISSADLKGQVRFHLPNLQPSTANLQPPPATDRRVPAASPASRVTRAMDRTTCRDRLLRTGAPPLPGAPRG